MSEGRNIEIRRATVEEAVEAGLAQLGLKRNDVIVDVIDEGSKGILGLGAREAVVRLVPMVTTPVAPTPPPPPPVRRQPSPPQRQPTPPKEGKVEGGRAGGTAVLAEFSTEELEKERDTALDIMHTLLQKMQIEAEITAVVTEPDDLTGRQINLIQVTGRDLGVLIGPRGETLNALQYIGRLMVGHRLHQRADFIVDIEGYRERRKQALARLAERMAGKVIKQRRPVSLEPMPPNERRVIHMALREYAEVYTQSTGEGKIGRAHV